MRRISETTGTPYAITRPSDVSYVPVPLGDGLEVAIYAGPEHGAMHLETATARLAPGGAVPGHVHPFEESFYITSGEGFLAIGDLSYRVREGDFGFVPIGVPHAWSADGDDPLEWLRVRAPQPRPIGGVVGTYPADLAVPTSGRPIDVESVSQRWVGHFDDTQVPPPGPLAMPGYHGYNIRNVSIRMMVDGTLGAQQHTLFIVEFEPSTVATGMSAKEHYHPFEEIYYFLRGSADGIVGGEPVEVGAGDLVFAGVNTSHGFTNNGDVPMRWIEAQSPMPPEMHGTLFEEDWLRLEG